MYYLCHQASSLNSLFCGRSPPILSSPSESACQMPHDYHFRGTTQVDTVTTRRWKTNALDTNLSMSRCSFLFPGLRALLMSMAWLLRCHFHPSGSATAIRTPLSCVARVLVCPSMSLVSSVVEQPAQELCTELINQRICNRERLNAS